MKPRVFIGSSKESLEYAYAVQKNLGTEVEATVWQQGIFKPSNFSLESLLNALNNFDFGIFVFAPDDLTFLKNEVVTTVRDNVVFEFGLFMGRLGRHRNFFLVPSDQKSLHIITDLAGLTYGSFDATRLNDLQAALGPASHDILLEIRKLGPTQELVSPLLPPPKKSTDDEQESAYDETDDEFDEVDIMSLLTVYLRKYSGIGISVEIFSQVDREAELPSGSAKKYLEVAAKQLGLHTSLKGKQTISVDYKRYA